MGSSSTSLAARAARISVSPTMKVAAEAMALKAKGVDVDTARDQLMPSLAGPMATLTGGNAALNDAFKVQLVDWYLHRVYEELDGPLTDAIAAIPQK